MPCTTSGAAFAVKPVSPLVIDSAGNLYGLTNQGGLQTDPCVVATMGGNFYGTLSSGGAPTTLLSESLVT